MTEQMTIVPAGAGSGKTYRIKSDLTKWVKDQEVAPDRILAVTYTEAAAAELRGRIRSSLLAEGLVEEALAVEQAYVSTIHSLGRRILTEHAFAAGASPQPRVLETSEADLLLRQAMAHAPSLKRIKDNLPRFGYRWRKGRANSAEDDFRKKLRDTINLLRTLGDYGDDPHLVDSGIERVRAIYGRVEVDAKPLETQLVTAIKALLSKFPNELTSIATNKTARTEFARDHQNLKRALRPDELNGDWALWVALSQLRHNVRGAPTPEGYDELASQVIEMAKQIVVHPGPLNDACEHLRALICGAQEAMAQYAEVKREAGVIDYADMISDAERLLRTRPEVLDALLSEVDCVIIDEFQDTNPVQFALLWQIIQSDKRVLIVGDTKQSIMGFQGADHRLMGALEDHYSKEVSAQNTNWRSDPRLMHLVNAISAGLFKESYVKLNPQRPETGKTYAEILRIPEGPRSNKSRPEMHVADRIAAILKDEENEVVKPEVHPKHPEFRPIKAGDVAILVPTHSKATKYANALRAQGVPVRISSDGWWNSPVVMAARSAVSYAVDTTDRQAALMLLTIGPTGMPLQEAMTLLANGELDTYPELEGLRKLAESAHTMPLDTLLPQALTLAGIPNWAKTLPEPAQAHADLMRLYSEVSAFSAAHRNYKAAAGFHGEGAQVFLGWLETRRKEEKDFDRHPDPGQSQEQGVEIVTWHAAKGREWPIAVVVGLDDKFSEKAGALCAEFKDFSKLDAILKQATLIWTPDLAIKEKRDAFIADRRPASENEARRKLYVALTRARDRLIIEWPDHALDKLKDKDPTQSYGGILLREVKMRPQKEELKVGDQSFPIRIIPCDAEAPDLRDCSDSEGDKPRLAFGEHRPMPDMPRTAWRIRPSTIEQTSLVSVQTRIVPLQSSPATASLEATASERGTALHRAIRVLLKHPELRPHLSGATGFDEPTLDRLKQQVEALKEWLDAEGYIQIDCEVPIQKREASGAEFNGTIDLLATGPGKHLILDHKSGDGAFADYLAQLYAYRDHIAARDNASASDIAIHWIDRGKLEVLCEPMSVQAV